MHNSAGVCWGGWVCMPNAFVDALILPALNAKPCAHSGNEVLMLVHSVPEELAAAEPFRLKGVIQPL